MTGVLGTFTHSRPKDYITSTLVENSESLACSARTRCGEHILSPSREISIRHVEHAKALSELRNLIPWENLASRKNFP